MASAEQAAYDTIRSGITAGRLRSGMHLSAGEFANQLGISRTPVREALRRLHAEGFVEFLPNRGAYVTSWTHHDIEEVFRLRIVLESHAAELAAARLHEGQIERLRALAASIEQLVAERPARYLDRVAEQNREFHQIIVAAASSRRLAAMIAGLVEMSLVVRTFTSYSADDLARSMAHHRELLTAFARRDGTWAGYVMRNHIRAAYHVFIASLSTAPNDPASDIRPVAPGGTGSGYAAGPLPSVVVTRPSAKSPSRLPRGRAEGGP